MYVCMDGWMDVLELIAPINLGAMKSSIYYYGLS
jgi:hypothetical protein